ncbi:MAG TPA: hypothetical protein VKH82_14445 [Candidatus Binatia bacterium]|nr:hypothetical protein [Candidatus Binatia bacterium]
MSLETACEDFTEADHACWQRRTLAYLERSMTRERALRELVARYLEHAASGRPVHEWPMDA